MKADFMFVIGQYKPVATIPREFSFNMSVAGSIVLYDRLLKNEGFVV